MGRLTIPLIEDCLEHGHRDALPIRERRACGLSCVPAGAVVPAEA